jgi:short-subunit dehydrogenase
MSTALITGASSGIGAAFARRLARDGYNLILVARRREKLEALARELEAAHGIRAEVLVADLARISEIERVEARITELGSDLALLINNAGFGTNGQFHEVTPERHTDMINVHVTASVRLSRAAMPRMLACGQGGVINVASIAAFFPLPGNANYSASKAYLVTFCEALAKEIKGSGVKVQALCPGFTVTEFHDTPEYASFDRSQVPKTLWMSADEIVDDSLKALKRGRVVCIPGWKYRVLVAVGTNKPANAVLSILRRRAM